MTGRSRKAILAVAAALLAALVAAGVSLASHTVSITSAPPAQTPETSATFEWESTGPTNFRCDLDGDLVACGNGSAGSKTYENLEPGPHTFTVTGEDFVFCFPNPEDPPCPDPPPPPDESSDTHSWTITVPEPPKPPPGTTIQILGPGVLQVGEAARFAADVEPDAESYEWDLDGDGSYETDTEGEPIAAHNFLRGGQQTVGLRATLPNGATVEGRRTVDVRRPTTTLIEVKPTIPEPGEEIKLTVKTSSDQGFKPVFYEWRIEGLKPVNRSITLPAKGASLRAARSGAQTVITSPNADLSTKPSLTRKLPSNGGGIQQRTVEVTLHDAAGNEQVANYTFNVMQSSQIGGLLSKIADRHRADGVWDCDKAVITTGVCASFDWDPKPPAVELGREPADQIVNNLTNTTPQTEICHLNEDFAAKPKIRALQQIDQRINPPIDSYSLPLNEIEVSDASIVHATPSANAGARAAINRREECKLIDPVTISWRIEDPDGKVTLLEQAETDEEGKPKYKGTNPHLAYQFERDGVHKVTLTSWTPIEAYGGQGNFENAEAYCAAKYGDVGGGVVSFNWSTDHPLTLCMIRAKITHELDVSAMQCGGLRLQENGGSWIDVGAIPHAGTPDDYDATGCFYYTDTPDGSKKREFWPITGWDVDLNTIRVPGEPRIVPQDNLIRAASPGGHVRGFRDNAYQVPLFDATGSLTIPAPKSSKDGVYSELTAIPGGPAVQGLKSNAVQVLLSKSRGAALRQWVLLPPPLSEDETKEVFVPGGTNKTVEPIPPPAGAASAAKPASHVPINFPCVHYPGENCALSIDISGLEVGLFAVKSMVIENRQSDHDWIGGGKPGGGPALSIPGVVDLYAPYLEPGQKEIPESDDLNGNLPQCNKITGPSGLRLGSAGDFKFAGATVIPSSPWPVGPVGINCVAIKGQTDPFQLEGLVGAQLPPTGEKAFQLDGCLVFAYLKAKQKTTGCSSSAKAPDTTTMVWFRAAAAVRLMDFVTLGGGWVDLRAAGDSCFEIEAGGQLGPIDLWVARANGKVVGNVVSCPKFGFSIDGSVQACVDTPFGEACRGMRVVLGTKGFGGCATIVVDIGFVYEWDGGLSLSCNLDVLKVGSAGAAMRGLSGLGPAANTVNVPPDQDSAGFLLTGSGGKVLPKITTPNDDVIELDPGVAPDLAQTSFNWKTPDTRGDTSPKDWGANPDDWMVIPIKDPQTGELTNQTAVFINKPTAGPYTIETAPGSAPLQEAEFGLPTPDPVVNPAGNVSGPIAGAGAKAGAAAKSGKRFRTLDYKVRNLGDDRLVFFEQGANTYRPLGSGHRGEGTLKIPFDLGPAGKRTIIAVVERDGVAYKEFKIGTYKAPGPPKVGKPGKVRAKVKKGKLQVGWQKAAGATSYEVRVTTGDGRITTVDTKKAKISLPAITRGTSIRVSVTGIGVTGLEGKSAGSKLDKLKPKPIKVKL